MSEITYKGYGQYRGLTLWYNAENGHQYVMKIWKDFKGVSYAEIDNHDKKIYKKHFYYSVSSSWDYHTAFAVLRGHFNLVKNCK